MFQHLLLDPPEFAAWHFGSLDLGHVKRNRRAVKVAAAMAARPWASLPVQTGDPHQAKAAYRFFDTPDLVTFESLASGHWLQTRQNLTSLKRVLLIGDGSEIDYTGHPDVVGLEPIGNGKGRGMNLQTVLAVDPDKGGQLQGIAYQDVFYRQQTDKTETRQQRLQRDDRQSRVWARSVAACGSPPPGTRFIHVCDCGGDDFSFFSACASHGSDFVSRIYQPRNAALGHDAQAGTQSLIELAKTLPVMGGKTVDLRSRKRQKKKVKVAGNRHASTVLKDTPARMAKLLVSAGPVTVFAPRTDQSGTDPLRPWVVRVWEPSPPEGVEPIEWTLPCSMPVPTLQDALRMAEWYRCRWLIEEYHKCLKTGCRIEWRQLENGDRLEAMPGIFVVVAARMLAIKQQAIEHPTRAAIESVEALKVQVLVKKQKLKTPAAELSVYEFWRQVARLGGFLGRKGDGEPGWQTLWLGWQELEMLTEGARLVLSEQDGT